jgi:hypothetical protein
MNCSQKYRLQFYITSDTIYAKASTLLDQKHGGKQLSQTIVFLRSREFFGVEWAAE